MHLHEAQQSRSRESQQRLLDAAARLLEQRSWDSVSIAEISREARMSVGGFYARFKSKDALLHVLHERYELQRTGHFKGFFASQAPGTPLRKRVRAMVDAVADWMHDNRGVLRTFLLRFWSTPEEFDNDFGNQLEGLYTNAVGFLVGDGSEIPSSKPRQAARLAINVLTASCRDTLVLKPQPRPSALRRSRSDFKRELTRFILCYLQEADSPRSR